jgi:hypothetical protein
MAPGRAPLQSSLKIQAAFERDTARVARPTPPNLLAQLKAAQCEKVANKTREHEHQRRGEVLSATRRQSRVGFPAHVPARWDPMAKVPKAKLIARRDAGQVKRALGYGTPPEDEEVDELARKRLDRLDEELRRSNRRRRWGGTYPADSGG